MSAYLPPRPIDATLSVTKAARLLGVHPNTVRTWSDAGRLRYYRINARGDRRYRLGDLQRFLAAAESAAIDGPVGTAAARRRHDHAPGLHPGGHLVGRPGFRPSREDADPLGAERHRRDLALLDHITRLTVVRGDLDDDLMRLAQEIRAATELALVALWELRNDRLTPRAAAVPAGAVTPRLLDLPRTFGVLGRALDAAPTTRARTDDEPSPGAVAVVSSGLDRVTSTILPGAFSEL